MKKLLLIFYAFFSFLVNAQNNIILEQKSDGFSDIMFIQLDNNLINISNNAYGLKICVPIKVTSFAVGWKSSSSNFQAGEFRISYRMHSINNAWSKWSSDDCLLNPDQNPQNIYKSDLLFGVDEYLHDSIEFYIFPPEGETIIDLFLFLQDISGYLGKNHSNKPEFLDAKSCPEFPAIITRTSWCGTNTDCSNPTYSVTYRPSMTHAIIHHGASPTSYTDGAAIVYSYWNYHVNSNGWSDIGYNYLFDKYGNFYQGRHNPQMPANDVQGAHAGNSNPYSIGCNFLGDSDSPETAPTQPQLSKCAEMLAWWFNNKNYDPASSASIIRQSDGALVTLPRICGHKDSNVGGTTCPGNALYALLPQIIQETANVINACADTTKPNTTISTEKNWQNNDFLINFNDVDNDNEGNITNTKFAFYQYEYYDGNSWKTNPNNGFINETFNSQNPQWVTVNGNWLINNDEITINTAETNTNIYANLLQESNYCYLYSWDMKFNSSGTNTRAGIHFMCSDPEETNRGNSFMVYFREHNNKVQIYRYGTNSSNESLYIYATNDDTEITAGVWYNIKVVYNPQTGKVDIYKDNSLVSTYTFSDNLFTSASAISLRVAEADVSFDNFAVYKTRQQTLLATIGENNDFPHESVNQNTAAGKVNTILLDYADNWSNIISQDFFIDTTKPNIIPVTQEEDWINSDFQFDILDNDSLSGISNSFYLIRCFDSSNWHANGNSGFAYDDFNEMSNWTNTNNTGNWNITDNTFVISDETAVNSQSYSILNQDSDEFLYSFDFKLEGAGSNKRGGFHYFSDDTTDNRGNGYFIYFRFPAGDLEFYKVTNDAFSQEKVVDISMTAEVFNNIKITYNRITGKSSVFINNQFISDWTDENPYQNGNYISFRSGNSIVTVDNLRVYKNRDASEFINVGNDADIFIQNNNPLVNSTVLETFTNDNAGNESSISYYNFNVDWTNPINIDTIIANVQIISSEPFVFDLIVSFSSSQDNNSGIAKYWISIGTSPAVDDIISWTNNYLDTNYNFSPILDSANYYVNVKAENAAGLFSVIKSKNIFNPFETHIISSADINNITIYPNPNNGNFYIDFGKLQGDYSLAIFDVKGNKILEKIINVKANIDVEINSKLSPGIYYLKVENKFLKFIIR